jgi:DEAD/DEAH box helicase domain-containing protein
VNASAVPLSTALEALRARLGAELAAELELPGEPASFGDPTPPLPAPLAAALAASGAPRLWRHQAEAFSAARAGENVLVTTATASGKSLVFQLPVLEEALAGGSGRALFLFPLKALGQDQRAKFAAIAAAAGLDEEAAACAIYDGDTPPHERAKIRRRPPRVLITNPDMLHLGLLPHAGAWSEFLRDLRWIVLDELHAYRGIFGCHFHHVLARLLRHTRALGARPSFIAASATAAGADEFAAALAGAPFRWVSSSGAPREARRFLLVRPHGSAYTTALDVFSTLIENGQKTIAFTKARRITELLWTWLARRDRELARRVRSYRAGFLPEERREIERRLFAGELDGVLSTSALEMGIDVGGLDACVLVGYPGSAMATWQRSGRVGRSGRPSLTVLVALPDALDQWLLDHPSQLVERPLERLVMDPDNELVARQHLVCAAVERPLSPASDGALLERFAPVVGELLREGKLARSADGPELVSTARRPTSGVSLRGSGASFTIQLAGSGVTIGLVDGARVFSECHPGAIYLHGGRSFAVRALDLEGRRVEVEPADVDWYTSPLSEKETEILEVRAELAGAALRAAWGNLEVTERVVGFERRRNQGQDVLDRQPLELPPVSFEAHGFWFHAPPGAEARFAAAGHGLLGALHAIEHASIGLLPLSVLCDRNDLGGVSLSFHPQLGGPGVFVYEGHAGGVGIAARAFRELPALLGRVAELLERCPCEEGCPSCVQSPKCGNGNRPLDKAGALELARELAAGAESATVQTAAGERRPKRGAAGVAPVARRSARGLARAAPDDLPSTARLSPSISAFTRDEGTRDGADGVPLTARPSPVSAETAGASRARLAAGRGRRTVLFDVETLRSADEVGGWTKAHRMGVAVAVALHLEEGRFETYHEPDVPGLIAALKAAGLVVGFNSRRFDYAVLSGYTGEDFSRTLPTLDLLESLRARLGYRVGLGHVARETLGADKTADGLQSLEWVRAGRLDLVEEYCRRDVELLRDVYLFGRREGYVLVADRAAGRIRVEVDW